MRKLFGTDGIRGKANIHPMTPEIAMAVGQAIARHFKHQKTTHRIVIGKDTRRSSYMIELAIASGVCSMGSDAIFLGPMSTPGVAFLTRAMRADAGIMISASHNLFSDNGVKFFDRSGYKLSDDIELEIEKIVEGKTLQTDRPVGEKIGKAFRVDDALGRYVEFLKRSFPKTLTLDGVKIVIDCANGAAYKLAPMVLWELGAEVISIGVEPNGVNINSKCGALHPQAIVDKVKETQAHIGIALDGDADRVIFCDENGRIVDGDQIIALCALEMLEQGVLTKNKIVGTILSNMGVENFLKGHGIEMTRSQVGDRYIAEIMRSQGLALGGEPSGHVIFSKLSTAGDGMIAALQVLGAVVKSKKKLSQLVSEIPLYPQVNRNIKVKSQKPINDIPEIVSAIKSLELRLQSKGRAVVRYSGTEPVLRLMIEGENQQIIQTELDQLTKIAETYLS